jgi:hypothetical protein
MISCTQMVNRTWRYANNISIEWKADGQPKPKIVWVTSEGIAWHLKLFKQNLFIWFIEQSQKRELMVKFWL